MLMWLFFPTVQPMRMASSSRGAVAVGENITLWCMSQSSNPSVKMKWKEGGATIASDYITTTSFQDVFFGTKVQSTVVLLAKKERSGHLVTCTPEYDGVLLDELSKQYLLNVTCLYYLFSLYDH